MQQFSSELIIQKLRQNVWYKIFKFAFGSSTNVMPKVVWYSATQYNFLVCHGSQKVSSGFFMCKNEWVLLNKWDNIQKNLICRKLKELFSNISYAINNLSSLWINRINLNLRGLENYSKLATTAWKVVDQLWAKLLTSHALQFVWCICQCIWKENECNERCFKFL